MNKPKLTPWFSGVDTPMRIGVFERKRWNDDVTFYSFWDGKTWWPSGNTPDKAVDEFVKYQELGVPRWVSQMMPWRGLTGGASS